ncbi:hypothetical protein B0H10DRAFT_2106460 [Mycena sp. CBHHK59/15]|nr:hypothetical protein B0H10DRAFT_2106460 [Mycena sp. CBHHK59/15]
MPPSRQRHPLGRSDPTKYPKYAKSEVTDFLADAGFPRITYAQIEQMFDASGVPHDQERPGLIQKFLDDADRRGVAPLGVKPAAYNDPVEDLCFINIPNDNLSIRLFPGGSRPETGMFFFDFYDCFRHEAVNTPAGYTVIIVAPKDLEGPIGSVEAAFGFAPDEGLEKFAVMELVRCCLTRPGKQPYLFDIPRRTRHPERVGQAVRVRHM